MKPIHTLRHRPTPKPFKAEAAPEYAPGHFSALMLAPSKANPDGFPPRFEPQIQIDPRTKKFITEFAALHRPMVGFDRQHLGLPGATAYDRPVPAMTRQA